MAKTIAAASAHLVFGARPLIPSAVIVMQASCGALAFIASQMYDVFGGRPRPNRPSTASGLHGGLGLSRCTDAPRRGAIGSSMYGGDRERPRIREGHAELYS
jgi:hypothetical protein